MSIDCEPYPFRWLGHHDEHTPPLLRTHTYEFRSIKSEERYIVHVEEFAGEVYAVKFYCAKHKGQGDKLRYRLSVDTFDTPAICSTLVAICDDLLERYPNASFGLIASRSLDPARDAVEPRPTKRYRVWCGVIGRRLNPEKFTHYRFDEENAYLLVNRCYPDTDAKRDEYRDMFSKAYPIVPGI